MTVVSIVANAGARVSQDAISFRTARMNLTTQQLASGQRVFSAAQDPAALAVGTQLKLENVALKTAALNAGAAVSMLQIADGGLAQAGDILIRLRTLATQASSGQIGDVERGMLENEFVQLRDELGRIAQTTEFNGVKMLTGQTEILSDPSSSLTALGISNVRFDDAAVVSDRAFRVSYDAATEVLTLARVDGGAASSQTFDVTGLLDAVAGVGQNLSAGQNVEVGFGALGVTLTLDSSFVRGTAIAPTGSVAGLPAGTTATTPVFSYPATGLTPAGVDGIQGIGNPPYSGVTGMLTLGVVSNGATVTLNGVTNVAFAVNGGPVGALGAASPDLVNTGAGYVDVYVGVAGGGTERVGRFSYDSLTAGAAGAGTLTMEVGEGLFGADVTTNRTDKLLSYKVGNGLGVGEGLIQVRIPPITVPALGLDTLRVNTLTNANTAITALDAAQVLLNSVRANVGAQQSRLDYVTNNIDVVVENNEFSRSALLDVDASKAISDLATDTTMMQVGVAMLGQANRMSSMLLDLLRNG